MAGYNSKYSGKEVENVLDESKDVLDKTKYGEQFTMYQGGLGGNTILPSEYNRYLTNEQIQTLLSGGAVSITGYVNTGGNNPAAITIQFDRRTGWLKGSGKDSYNEVTDGFVKIENGRFGQYLCVFKITDNGEWSNMFTNGLYISRSQPEYPLADIPYTLGIEYFGEDLNIDMTVQKEIRTFLGITEKNLYDLVKSGRPLNLHLNMGMTGEDICAVVNAPLSVLCMEEELFAILLSCTFFNLGTQFSIEIIISIDNGRYVQCYFAIHEYSTMYASTLSLPGKETEKVGTLSELVGALKTKMSNNNGDIQ